MLNRLYKTGIIWMLPALVLFVSCSQNQLKISSFCESLDPVHRILEDPEWASWDMAPIYDDSGRVHLFVGRWPSDGDWLVNAQIVHAVSHSPEGPYQVLDTIFQDDTISYYNPQINQVDGTYVMVYAYKERSLARINQKVGLATSGSLDGPWVESPFNPVLAPSYEKGSFDCLHASNPSFHTDMEGKYRIYYKTVSDQPDDPYLRTISLATSENIEGPYEAHPENPVISYVENGLDVEVIYYWNTFLDYSMYDAHKVYASHPEWWLRKLDGSLVKKRGNLMRYDLSNPEVREWGSCYPPPVM